MNQAGRLSMMAGKRLPYKKRVEYLESRGTQYIDVSSYFLNKPLRVTVKWCPLSSIKDMFIFGGGQYSSPQYFRFGVYGSSNPFVAPNGEVCNIFTGTYAGYAHIAEMIDGQYVIISSDVNMRDAQVYLFAQEWGKRPAGIIRARLLSVQFFLSAEICADFIPVIDWNDEPKMFDEVTQSYPTHYGSFIAGPDL